MGCSGVNIERAKRVQTRGGSERDECSVEWADTRVRRICTIEGERRWGNKVIPAALSRSGARRVSVKENTKGDK